MRRDREVRAGEVCAGHLALLMTTGRYYLSAISSSTYGGATLHGAVQLGTRSRYVNIALRKAVPAARNGDPR